MFTGIQVTPKHKENIESIGGKILENVDEASNATHVIAGDGVTALRRTPKLMICISRTSNILNSNWLAASAKEGMPLDCGEYLLLGDRGAEKKYDFVMKETLVNGIAVRQEQDGLLSGWHVFFCKGVAGNRAPPAPELNLIVLAAGGANLRSLSARETKKVNPSKVIIITSDPATSAQTSAKDAVRMTSNGAKVFTTTWLFHCIITQTLDVDAATAAQPTEHPSTPRSGRKRKAAPESSRRSSSRRKR